LDTIGVDRDIDRARLLFKHTGGLAADGVALQCALLLSPLCPYTVTEDMVCAFAEGRPVVAAHGPLQSAFTHAA
jgi:hypothetical protein